MTSQAKTPFGPKKKVLEPNSLTDHNITWNAGRGMSEEGFRHTGRDVTKQEVASPNRKWGLWSKRLDRSPPNFTSRHKNTGGVISANQKWCYKTGSDLTGQEVVPNSQTTEPITTKFEMQVKKHQGNDVGQTKVIHQNRKSSCQTGSGPSEPNGITDCHQTSHAGTWRTEEGI